MEVIVLEIDVDNRRLSLGHKQLTEDPGMFMKQFSLLVQFITEKFLMYLIKDLLFFSRTRS